MKRRLLLTALALVAMMAGLATFEPPPQTVTCITRSITCTAGTCTETAPSTNAGAALANIRTYYLRACADSGQTLSGAGTLRDYHCSGSLTPSCAQVNENAKSVTSTERCQEYTPFLVPYLDNTTDTFWWSPSGVTVSSGNLTVYICPAK